jgi:hypothetical protein
VLAGNELATGMILRKWLRKKQKGGDDKLQSSQLHRDSQKTVVAVEAVLHSER